MSPEPLAIGVVCGYELAALTTRRVPTITNLLLRSPRLARGLVVAAAAGWLAAHLQVTKGN